MQRVLVVEDDFDTFDMLWEVLRDGGYFVFGAVNGLEGLTQVQHHSPDLVMIDLMLPISSGIEMATALRADPRFCDLPLVAMSGLLRPIGGADGLFTDFLPKPFDAYDILYLVESVLGKAG